MRFVMIGGFLGAGKTTTIGQLARRYQSQGLHVGIVTNDQGPDLVDTHNLRSLGYEVGEVAGSCFCCNFDGLTQAALSLGQGRAPDVVLAEPVGSCTDLVATVIQPLLRLFEGTFDVAPYGVIVKPSHGRKILEGGLRAGFSPKAEYIFKKQLEEADFLIINRTDELTPQEVAELSGLLSQAQPGLPIVRISARTGEGFEALLEMLGQRGAFGRRVLEVDYDVYAEGEAELGWLNSRLEVAGPTEFSLDGMLLDLMGRLRSRLAERQAETAHLKAIGIADGSHAVANLVSSDAAVQLSLPSGCHTRDATLVVNARVAIDPEALAAVVHEAIEATCRQHGAHATLRDSQSFRPARPVPTHRFTAVTPAHAGVQSGVGLDSRGGPGFRLSPE